MEGKRMKSYMYRKISLILSLIMIAMLFVGCNSKETSKNDGNDDTVNTQETTPTPVVDPMAKYAEPITVTSFFEIAPPFQAYFTEDRIKNNIFAKQYLEELGIKVDYLWYAAQTPEDSVQKKNVAIASGEIPDIMMADADQLALLAKSDLINKDIGTIFDQYASEHLKEWIYGEGDAAMVSATYDGKVIAIPQVNSSIDLAPFLWIRKDWVEKLGLKMPATMEELYDVMVAFKNNDPDGNGKADTIGLIMNKDYLLGVASSDTYGLFNGFGSYPRAWVKDASGKLAYGSALPETKEALKFLNKLYSEGLIEKDFAVKDAQKASELPAAGTGGIQYGAMWNAMWPLQSSLQNDPTANWQAVSIVAAEGKEVKPQIKLNVPYYYVVSKDCKNPEALIKLLNFYVEKVGYSDAEEYAKYLTNDSGIEAFALHEAMIKVLNPLTNLNQYRLVSKAFENNNTEGLNAEQLNTYNQIVKYREGDVSLAGTEKTFGKDSSFQVMDTYYTNDRFMMDEFFGAPTETMKQKMQLIRDKEMEFFTKVIMGEESADNFDKFVTDLNKLGLDKITEEVNEWYSTR
jgi:putative aldouronate transport system substrate-binding protein